MNVVDEVIFAVWVAFWIYWLAASIGVKAGRMTRWTRFAGTRVGLDSRRPAFRARRDPHRACSYQRSMAARHRPGHLVPRAGAGRLGQGVPRPELGDADVPEGRSGADHNRSIPEHSPPDLLGRHPCDDRHHDRRQPVLGWYGWSCSGRASPAARLWRSASWPAASRTPYPQHKRLDQDADPLHLLSFRCIARSGASPPCQDPAGLFGQAVRVKSRRARWLDRVRSRGWPVQ